MDRNEEYRQNYSRGDEYLDNPWDNTSQPPASNAVVSPAWQAVQEYAARQRAYDATASNPAGYGVTETYAESAHWDENLVSNTTGWEGGPTAEAADPDQDDADLSAQLGSLNLADNSAYLDASNAQYAFQHQDFAEVWTETAADEEAAAEQPYEVDNTAEVWANPDLEVANGLRDVVSSFAFQLGRHPDTGREVIVPDGSPLTSPGHSSGGSPSRGSSSSSSSGEEERFRMHRKRAGEPSRLEQIRNGVWRGVKDEETRSRVGYAIGSALEGSGRIVAQSMMIATGNATIAGQDIVNRLHSLYTNLTGNPVDVPQAVRDGADLVGHGLNVAAGYALATGVRRDEGSATRIVLDRANVTAAGALNVASGAAFAVGAFAAGVQERRAAGRATGSEASDAGRERDRRDEGSHSEETTTREAAMMSGPYVSRGRDDAGHEAGPSGHSHAHGAETVRKRKVKGKARG